MAATILTLLLLLATAATALLTHRTVLHWRTEQAGRPYELPVDHRGTALRAGAAGAAALTAATLAVSLINRADTPDTATAPARATVASARPAADPRTAADPLPPPPPRTPEPAPPPPEVRTTGHPAGGTLQVLQDGTQVWLPPRYDSARAAGVAYPVVLARVPAPTDRALYDGFALQVQRRLADSFILVLPPDCNRDSATALAEVRRRYRALTAPTAQAVLGIGPEAPCAVHEALANPARYTAAVGVSGTYPPLARTPGPRPAVLLAASSGETAATRSARTLRAALRPGGADVRVLDGIASHRELFALVAAYLTEKLDGPARVSPPPAPVSPHPAPPSSSQSPSPSPSRVPQQPAPPPAPQPKTHP